MMIHEAAGQLGCYPRCVRHVQSYIGTHPHDSEATGRQGPIQTQGLAEGGGNWRGWFQNAQNFVFDGFCSVFFPRKD